MLTKETIEQRLESVIVPAAARTVTGLNLIRDIDINNENITVKLARTALNEGTQEWLREKITEAVQNAEKDAKISVEYIDATPAELNEIGNVIAIMSGKGGVGKSLIAGLTAISLNRMGKTAGILDADSNGIGPGDRIGDRTDFTDLAAVTPLRIGPQRYGDVLSRLELAKPVLGNTDGDFFL